MTTRVLVFRLIALAPLAITSLLLTDDLSRVPSFCPFQSGCAGVTTSPFGRPLGIPLSSVGLAAFATFFLLTLFEKTRAGRLLGPMALAAGAIGLLLVGVQFLILRQVCRYCLVVDAAAILLAAVELGLPRGRETLPRQGTRRGVWTATALVVAAIPPVWAALRPPPSVPAEVKQVWMAGKINVVEITDFTCPYCKRLHEALEDLRQNHPDGIHLARFVAPPLKHDVAVAAARAYACAVRQGRGERMADVLFTTEKCATENMRELARKAELDLVRFDADWKDAAIDQEIAATRRWVDEQGRAGLPQVWVQDIWLLGEQTAESLLAVARRAGVPSAEK